MTMNDRHHAQEIRQDRIRFHVRCCSRRGRTWGHTIAQVRRHFGWRLSSDVCARREWTRTNPGDQTCC